MIVVSDTSPIVNFACIRRLDLLRSLYDRVLIPPSVRRELTGANQDARGLIELALNSWMSVEAPKDQQLVLQLCSKLDAGEAEAIVLALEQQAGLLLIDEKLGREAAKSFGLHITGLLGVLVEARKAHLIDRVKPVLDQLMSEARFWIAPDLYREVLITVREI